MIWLATVGRDGWPQPNPVWFLWDGETFLIYNNARAKRLRHVRQRPEVSLNFDRDDRAGGVVVIAGRAEVSAGEPPASEMPEFLAKYAGRMVLTRPEEWARQFPVALRIRPVKVRSH